MVGVTLMVGITRTGAAFGLLAAAAAALRFLRPSDATPIGTTPTDGYSP